MPATTDQRWPRGGPDTRGRGLRRAARATAGDRPLRRRLPDAEPDRRDAGQLRSTWATTPTLATTRCREPAGATRRARPADPESTRRRTTCCWRSPPAAGSTGSLRRASRLRSRSVVDTEGLALAPGQTWELEEFTVAAGADREALLDGLARRTRPTIIRRCASRRRPTGWCSWYCFGPQRHRASRCSTTSTSSRPRRARPEVHPDRRRLPAGHGRLARHRAGLRRRRAGRARGDSQARASSRRSGSRRSSPRPARSCSSSIPTGS